MGVKIITQTLVDTINEIGIQIAATLERISMDNNRELRRLDRSLREVFARERDYINKDQV